MRLREYCLPSLWGRVDLDLQTRKEIQEGGAVLDAGFRKM